MRTKAELRGYQKRMAKLAYRQPFCALLLRVGAGKTAVVLTLLEYLLRKKEAQKVLIVGPLRVVNSVWEAEAQEWTHTSWLKFSRILGNRDDRVAGYRKKAHIYLINIDNFVWLLDELKDEWPFDVVIADEFSMFKHQSSNRSKALRGLRRSGVLKRLIGMTGTPVSNGMLDLWNQVWILDKGHRLGRYMKTYKDMYFYIPPSQQRNQYAKPVLMPGAEKEIYKKVGDICFSMRNDEYPQLPELVANPIQVEMPDNAWNHYNDLARKFFTQLADGEFIDIATAAVQSNKLLQCANGCLYTEDAYEELHRSKVEALGDLIEELQGDPLLVGYHYNFDRDRLLKAFPEARVLDKSQATIDDWNAGKIPILLAHPACLHPETEVLTEHRGWVRLMDVSESDRVFDGVEFVSHSGCFLSGTKPVVDRFGIKMTDDHKLLINGKWVEAEHVQETEQVKAQARYQYKGDDLYLRSMFELRDRAVGSGTERKPVKQTKKKTLFTLSLRGLSQHDRNPYMANMARNGTASIKLIRQGLCKVRGVWTRGVRGMAKFQNILQRHGNWVLRRPYARTDRQHKRVLERKLPLGYQHGTTVQQSKLSLRRVPRGADASGGVLPYGWRVPRCVNPATEPGDVGRRSSRGLEAVEVPEKQEVSPVYDLVDCGPRNRFIVRNAEGEAFISHNSAGHGLNLQAGGSNLVFFSLSWNLELHEQFIGRLYRQGQKRTTFMHYIYVPGTIEEDVIDRLEGKKSVQDALMSAMVRFN